MHRAHLAARVNAIAQFPVATVASNDAQCVCTNLLVKGGGLEAERVDNVVDLLGTVGEGLLLLLGGGVGT